ncbi:coiled-coil domain-containing protein 142 isoform X2 [Diceros bicornis minor]|uniref:coiled-coil domain-containing protein 142 isoform X2 n=1 Tax=Diceros bicornis minor TaxID=77932 RepID=UPI0026EB434D|nr:coiled-coil domain-containing protein 142 isoform X2 [Diceros bicornis minor]
MAQASRSGGLLPPLATVPPLWARPDGAGEEPRERRLAGAVGRDVQGCPGLPVAGSIPCLDPRPGGAPGGQPWWAAPAEAGENHEAGAADWRREPAAGGPIPPVLQRLRAVLLRLHREREQLLQARDYARHLQAAVSLLRIPSPGAPSPGPGPLPQLCRDLLPHPSRGAVLRTGLRETPEPLLVARPAGLAAQSLDAAIEMQLRALGRAPAGQGLSSQLADLLLALPAYHQLQGKAVSHLPGAARPFPPARVLRLLTGERGCQVAGRLDEALRGSGLRDQLRRRCHEERELLPGLLGLMGGVAGSASSGLGLGGAGALWSQYWTLLWAACAQSLDLSLGPWRDPRGAAEQLSQALGQASLPQECEKELASLCHNLLHQSLIWSWDQGFCQALGSAGGDQSSLPSCSHTTELLQQLFPPLLDALREPKSRLLLYQPPGPAPLALGLCTLQTTLLWFWGRAQQHLAAWAPGSFLPLIQKDLPPLLHEAGALSRLASEESLALEVEQQLGLEIRKLTAQIQLLPQESLSLFFQECHKQATQGFELYMPRGRYWRHRLRPGNSSSDIPFHSSQGIIVSQPLQILAPLLSPSLSSSSVCPHPKILCSAPRHPIRDSMDLHSLIFCPFSSLTPELPSTPSEYAWLVVRTVLEPVLQGLQGLPPQAQAPALGQVLTAILGAWLDHILTHGIRFSLQGTLQLRQDFGVVRELLEEEQWGLSPELRQTLLMLSIFQQLDGALLCLLQQPLPKTRGHRWPPCCCACNEVQTMELPSSSLNSLESLEPPLQPGAPPTQTAQLLSTLWGGGPSPEAYLVGNQQAWLALRQHQHPRWHLPFLSCLGTSSES